MTDRKQSEAPNVERSTPHSTKFAECIIFLVGVVVIAAWWFWPSVLSPMLKRTVPNVDPLSAHPPWLMGMEPVADSAATADSYLAQLGQMGDTFGSINALFAALTVVAVFWAGYLQRVTLKEAQQQISNQDAELKAQRESRNLAQFERNFYELLKLTIAVSNRFRVQSKNGMPLTGSAAFDAVASHYFGGVAIDSIATGSGVDQLDRLVDIYRTEVYGRFSAKIGPWFREPLNNLANCTPFGTALLRIEVCEGFFGRFLRNRARFPPLTLPADAVVLSSPTNAFARGKDSPAQTV